MIVGVVLVLAPDPQLLVDNVAARRRADVEGLHPRDPDRHDRLHGHRDDLEHGRGGQGRDQDDPRGDQARGDRRVRDLLHAAGGRARRAAGHAGRRRQYQTLLGLPEDQGGYAGDPIAGVVATSTSGCSSAPAEIYVGILAATILFLATNAGLIGVSRLVYSMGIHRQLPDRLRQLHPRYRTPWIGILVFGVVAILITLPGQADFLGYLYAFGAMLSFTIAHLAVIRLRITKPDVPRPYRGPGNVTDRAARHRRCSRSSAGSAPARRSSSPSCCTPTSRSPASAGWPSAWSSTCSTGAARGSTSRRRTRSRSRSPSSITRPSTTPCSSPLADACYDESVIATAVQAGGPQAARDPRARARHRARALPIDAPMPEAESPRPSR